jgi:hypothetical protein
MKKKALAALVLLFVCGCSMADLRREWLGLSVSDVMNSKLRQTEQYDIVGEDCYMKISGMLKEMDAIVRENRHNGFIVADNLQKVFRPAINTTQVGIVVTAWKSGKTQVDVASENTDLAIFVSKKIRDRLVPVKPQPATEAGGA